MPIELPRVNALDATPALLARPYGWISASCDTLGCDAFVARLMLQDTVCLRGREAAELFYDTTHFQRDGGLPSLVKNVLLGKHGVQGLDNAPHRHRKALWLSLMSPTALADFATLAEDAFEEAIVEWQGLHEVVLHETLRTLVARIVFRWAGVPIDEAGLAERAAALATMYEDVASVGVGHPRARRARSASDRWATGLIEDVRSGELQVAPDRAIARIAAHRDSDGRLLDAEIAAVELLNVLRPTIAVARYVVYVVHALHRHPECLHAIRLHPAQQLEPFVQEIRRVYPFFPLLGARTRHDITFRSMRLPADTRVLLDIPGTHRDPAVWHDPERFDPTRFIDRCIDPFELIAQGGGDHAINHRCAGEWMTILLMRIGVRRFAIELDWDVPEQDLHVVDTEVPAYVASGMVLSSVRPRVKRRRTAADGLTVD